MKDELIARLVRLERIEAVRRAIHEYCRSVDDRDAAALAEHFAPEAVVTTSDGTEHRSDGIASYFQDIFSTPGGHHYVTHSVIDGDGDVVTAMSMFLVLRQSPSASLGMGWYQDEFTVGDDGAGKCVSKRITLVGKIPLEPLRHGR